VGVVLESVPIYSFIDKLHRLMNTATALLELLAALLEYLDQQLGMGAGAPSGSTPVEHIGYGIL